MKTSTKLLLLTVLVILFASCAHVVPIEKCVEGTKIYGFWNGLWHGLIAGITFIGSLFDHDVAVYAVNNNGGWYDFGFLLGVGSSMGGGTKVVYRKK